MRDQLTDSRSGLRESKEREARLRKEIVLQENLGVGML